MSKLSTHLKGHASTATAAENRTWNKGDAGPFVGIVKDNKDPARMGRLKEKAKKELEAKSSAESIKFCMACSRNPGQQTNERTNGRTDEQASKQ